MGYRLAGLLIVLLVAVAAGGWLLSREGAADEVTVIAWGQPGRSGPKRFLKPRCIAWAPDGTLYVLDLTGRIQHFADGGDSLGELRMPSIEIGRPQGIDVGPDGSVYVADTHYNRIVKFAPDGEIVLTFGEEGEAPGRFFWPCAIVVGDDGLIYTAEYGGNDRIQVWHADGTLLRHWGGFGEEAGDFMRPAGLALGPDGNLYVADACNHRVQVFSKEGTHLRMWGSDGDRPGELHYPYDIAVDGRGRVYVAEFGAHRVQCFTPDGRSLATWGRLADKGDGLSHPWGLDVDGDGRVVVADTYNGRVVQLTFAPLLPPDR